MSWVCRQRLASLLLLLAPVSLFLVTGCGGRAGADAAEEEAAGADHVVAAKPKPFRLGDWVTLAGATQPLPNHAARISNAVEGRVLEILPAGQNGKKLGEGDWVDAGQVIARLDRTVAEAGRVKAQADLNDAQSVTLQAHNAVDEARRALDRANQLRSEQQPGRPLISEAEYNKAQINLRNAQAQEKAAAAKEAGFRAALGAIDKQLDFYDLRSPIAGYLSTIQAVPGQTLTVGTPIADVMNLKEIDVLCYAPPSMVDQLRLGQAAQIVGSNTQAPKPGSPEDKVVYIAVQAQPDSGSFAVKVRFSNEKLSLRANALVQVRIETQPAKDRLMIPASALMDDTQPPQVFVAQFEVPKEEDAKDDEKPADEDKGEKKEEKAWVAHRYEAITGVHDPVHHQVEIVGLRGLKKDDQPPDVKSAWFVTSGWHGIKPGDKLEVDFKK